MGQRWQSGRPVLAIVVLIFIDETYEYIRIWHDFCIEMKQGGNMRPLLYPT